MLLLSDKSGDRGSLFDIRLEDIKHRCSGVLYRKRRSFVIELAKCELCSAKFTKQVTDAQLVSVSELTKLEPEP